MPIGGGDGGGSGGAARGTGAVRVPPQQWHFDGGGQVDETDEAVANAIGSHSPVSDADGTDPLASSHPADGGGKTRNNGSEEETGAALDHPQQGGRHVRCFRAILGVQTEAVSSSGSESFL